jgi:peptidoglycan/LPS O-acetylase OafA/YrhL
VSEPQTSPPQAARRWGGWIGFLHGGDLRHVPAGSGLGYRPDIDGMRAIAVVAVLLFHGGLLGFTGGYVGVDIFFVISGYLIGSIVIGQSDAGTFSIVGFYDRRVRRIIPPLFAVITTTLAGGYFLLLPAQFKGLGYEALTAAGFSSNVWFWRQPGYFHPDSHVQPLLHTWSLGVEEQFYLFFPPLVLVLRRIGPSFLTYVVGAIALLSFAASAALLADYPSATFFLLPTRAWELMIGVFLAARGVPDLRSRSVAEAVVLVGLALMIAPCVLFSATTPFPGLAALPPTLGAALVIWGGAQRTSATSVLGSQPMVFVGLLSYSLYLWHWPVFVALRHLTATVDLSWPVAASGIALSFLLSIASVRLVEAPVRNRRLTPPARLYPIILAVLAIIVAASLWIVRHDGVPNRLSPRVQALAAGTNDFDPRSKACLDLPLATVGQSCRLGASGAPTFMLWGDSHAAAIAPAISAIAAADRRSGVLFAGAGCFPVFDVAPPGMTPIDRARCIRRGADARRLLAQNPGISEVILTARWRRGNEDPSPAIVQALERTVAELRASGKQVVVLGGLPLPRTNIPWALGVAANVGIDPGQLVARPALSPFYRAVISLRDAGAVRFIDLGPPLCTDGRCASERDGKPLFTDDNHVSTFAATRFLAPYLKQQRLFAPSPAGANADHMRK